MRLFALIFLVLIILIGVFIGVYLVQSIALFDEFRFIFWLTHFILISSIFIAPIIYRIYPINYKNRLYDNIQFISYFLMGFYFVLFGFVFISQLGIETLINVSVANEGSRVLLKSSFAYFALGLSGVISAIGYFTAMKEPEIVKIKVPLDNLPPDLVGLKIVQLSDVHVGQTIKSEFVKKIVATTNELKADIVVLTGDFIDGSVYQLKDEINYFKNLSALLGVYYVPGNHEYYWNVEDWVKEFRELGAIPLLNSHIILKKNQTKFIIAGVHDYSAEKISPQYKSSPAQAMYGAQDNLIKILLAHQPKSAYAAELAGFNLQLSGHSHAGQFFPSSLLIYLFQPFVKGLYKYKKLWVYVNRGTGYWGPPNRMGVPSEITLIELINSTNVQVG